MTTSAEWSSLALPSEILRVLGENGFTHLMPVQNSVIPLFKKNADLQVEAITGSGKTLSFVVPLVVDLLGSRNLKPKDIQLLVLSPTRELCQQTLRVVEMFTEAIPQLAGCVCAVAGGRPLQQDLEAFREGRVLLLATVGRLHEIVQAEGQGCLGKVEKLVIDEADRILREKGLSEVMGSLPRIRRTYLFSATLQNIQA
jgi:superfamily II DNA/RNA helicase